MKILKCKITKLAAAAMVTITSGAAMADTRISCRIQAPGEGTNRQVTIDVADCRALTPYGCQTGDRVPYYLYVENVESKSGRPDAHIAATVYADADGLYQDQFVQLITAGQTLRVPNVMPGVSRLVLGDRLYEVRCQSGQ